MVNRVGATVGLGSLTAAERDQVYLSFCLALVSTAVREGVELPLVLDDPFLRLDARGTAALAAVLEEFGRRGHQILLFTEQAGAAERLTSLGVDVRDILSLRRWGREPADVTVEPRAGAETATDSAGAIDEEGASGEEGDSTENAESSQNARKRRAARSVP